ncbi:hypothetical protein [Clostridium sp.]|uniref:hypothetical protein n=1 Tax=Clostridium sp. TaxID=1506 RepID=UPI001B6B5ABC|nr:hypothetical protein [Clostridium sp.]MBP3915720.1 hypothetical protein [Clostridium sp.]
MNKLLYKNFKDIDFFLSDKVEIPSLYYGAEKYGGGTQIGMELYSNIQKDDYIKLNKTLNYIAIFIPSTICTDFYINYDKYVKKYYNILKNKYPNNSIVEIGGFGSWYSDKLNKVVIENITVIEVTFDKDDIKKEIEYFIELAKLVKKEMKQESVSISINSSLCLI